MGIKLGPERAGNLAREAYLFGFPLVYIATQIDVLTHVTAPQGARAPLNQFAHYRAFPDASNKTVVGFNVDTLYSLAQLDVGSEPLVLSVPEMGERFWIMQLIDAWNNVPAAPGSRSVGGTGGNFAIVGPSWEGVLPQGLVELRSPTSLVIVGGRIYTAGPDDYAAVHALQDQLGLVPLSAWGSDHAPPAEVALKPGVQDAPVGGQVMALSAEEYFNRLNALLVGNPPEPSDPEFMRRIAALGVATGATFSTDGFDAETRAAIDQGVKDAQQAIRDEEPKLGEHVNGWNLSRDLGRYGTKYTYRAAWTFFGVGGNLIEDAFYPLSLVDADGRRYDGANRYILRFSKEQLPPVEAFWSVTMYDADSYLVDNPVDRYALGDRSGMTFGDDGSLTVFIQSDQPDEEQIANWLPAPAGGGFKLALRLYVPKAEVADSGWVPPAVEQVG